MDGTNGFKALAAHMITKQLPDAVAQGSSHPMVNALMTLVSEALEAWYTPGAALYFATTDYLNAATAARETAKTTETKEESI